MSAASRERVHALKALVVRTLRLEGLEPEAIGDDQPLFAGGLGLDSVDALELVVALEREYGVAVPSAEVGSRHFATIGALADWLEAELAGRPAATAGAASTAE